MIKRDIANVNRFFSRLDVEVFSDEELYKMVVGK
jgi:serine/threonine-protein kinase RIO1